MSPSGCVGRSKEFYRTREGISMQRNKKRVLVGMSGGLDSSVTAAMLVREGYEVIGITIKTYKYEDVGGNVGNDSSCCSLDGINDARRVAMMLGIPHYVVDFTEIFKAKIIDDFVDTYMDGETPNPCVRCNRYIKFGEMLRKADSLGAEYIAMGHYASIRYDEQQARWLVARGNDPNKDQSYMLWGLTQESLARTLFPLAGFVKERSRDLAREWGLPIAEKGESYEICFVADNDYRRFLRDNAKRHGIDGLAGGEIVRDGEVLGSHNGYPFYTVGQRKGLGLSNPDPLYVLDVIPSSNTVVVGSEGELDHNMLTADSVNLIKFGQLREPMEFTAKIRYKDPGARAMCSVDPATGMLVVRFAETRRAIAPGQSVVLYDGDDVVGGGVIKTRAFVESPYPNC